MFEAFKRRKIIVSAVALLALVTVTAAVSAVTPEAVPAMADKSDWGLSFEENGKTPVGNATGEYLAKFDAAYAGDGAEKVIYLTFDAGYENGYTEKILDVLKDKGVSAAFFVVGNYIEDNPGIVKRMTIEGHIVGNHTYSHPNMSKIEDRAAFEEEIVKLEEAYKTATGEDMKKYYRPPRGKFSESNLVMAKDLGYRTVFWSLAYVDWYKDRQPKHEEAFDKLISRIHPGAVVLLHSTSRTNAEILEELITRWEDMGYTFGTLDELYK